MFNCNCPPLAVLHRQNILLLGLYVMFTIRSYHHLLTITPLTDLNTSPSSRTSKNSSSPVESPQWTAKLCRCACLEFDGFKSTSFPFCKLKHIWICIKFEMKHFGVHCIIQKSINCIFITRPIQSTVVPKSQILCGQWVIFKNIIFIVF